MLDVDSVLEEVAAQVGLDDYGHPSFRDGLDVLNDHIDAARLTPLGDAVFDGTVRRALANRLRVTDWHTTHPEVGAHVPEVAIVVVGLSRTGTTALSHLLGADPANRSLRGWEATESVPPPTTATYWTDPRFDAARTSVSVVDQINPGFKAIHHDEPDEPVECAVPLSQHFASVSFSNLFNVEAYEDWLLAADLTHAYGFHRQVLQVLQSDCPGPWQLKSPVHGYAMETVAAAYPNALFVQPHRDPARCIASTCSLTASLSGTFTDHDFRASIARRWPEILATMLDRIVEFRSRHGDDRFVDLAYRDVVDDPIGCVRRIYARLGRELTPGTEATMRDHLATATQHRYGTHVYSLAEFGLRREQLDERLSRYLDRFDVPREQA
jgi:hypothetical protein